MAHITWIILIAAGYFIMAALFSCKEETFSPGSISSFASRSEGREDSLDLLGISCFPDSLIDVCDSFPTIDSMQIMLPDYPGCTFWISFEYYECRNGSYQYYHIGSFHIVSHNCPAFWTAFSSAYAAGGATMAAFIENFDHDVFLQIKTNLANTLVPVGTNPCGTSFVVFMDYIRVSCYKWCYIQNGQTVTSIRVACGSDCCPELTRACRDENGNLVLITSNVSSYPPHCTGPIIYDAGQPPKLCTSESSCEYHCPE